MPGCVLEQGPGLGWRGWVVDPAGDPAACGVETTVGANEPQRIGVGIHLSVKHSQQYQKRLSNNAGDMLVW